MAEFKKLQVLNLPVTFLGKENGLAVVQYGGVEFFAQEYHLENRADAKELGQRCLDLEEKLANVKNEKIKEEELPYLRKCHKGHVFIYGHPGKPFAHSPDCIFCLDTEKIEQENAKLREDAERWRAFISSDRIRILGTGSLGKEFQHIGMEIWENYPGVEPDSKKYGVEVLTTYVDAIRTRK